MIAYAMISSLIVIFGSIFLMRVATKASGEKNDRRILMLFAIFVFLWGINRIFLGYLGNRDFYFYNLIEMLVRLSGGAAVGAFFSLFITGGWKRIAKAKI